MNAGDILKYGHKTLHGCLEGLPESERETPNVCGVWSTKDIVAHMASFERVLEELLQGFAAHNHAPGPLLTEMVQANPDAYNAHQVDMRRGRGFVDILDELDNAHRRTVTLAAQIPAQTWRQSGLLPWYGDQYALDDFIVYSFYGHKREHGAQINIFKDSLKR